MPVFTGRGELSFADGHKWGFVRYSISVVDVSRLSTGFIAGTFKALDPAASEHPAPFHEFYESRTGGGILKLEDGDGRWWLCNVQANGEASNRGGFSQNAPQTKA